MNTTTAAVKPAIARDADGIPTAWVVWIDDDMGYGVPNWEIDNPGDHPEEPLATALQHAAETISRGYPTAILPRGMSPRHTVFHQTTGAANPLADHNADRRFFAISQKRTQALDPAQRDVRFYRPKRMPGAKHHKSILVYGPQGSGKSLHAEELRKHFDLAAVLDDWHPGAPWPITDHLILSHFQPPAEIRRAIPIATALAMLQSNAPGYPVF